MSESELEVLARMYALADRETLITEILKREVRLSAANEEIGALKVELEWARRKR